jgi:hypothetical protein
MAINEGRKLGGQIMAKLQRELAIKKYYNNPNYCLFCNNIIEVGEKKVSIIKKKKFCNHICAASFNNKKRIYKNKDIVKDIVILPLKKIKNLISDRTKSNLFNSRKN